MPETGAEGVNFSIDLDIPQARTRRVVSQKSLEERLPSLFGQSFKERLQMVRVGIFGNIDNSAVGIREIELKVGPISHNYCSAALMKDRFLPAMAEIIDSLYDQVKALGGSSRAEAALRLASVIYTLGVPIHPYPDGNGQTLREVCLSYLHELAPSKYMDLYFPFKPTNTSRNNFENNIRTPILSPLIHINNSHIYTWNDIVKETLMRCGYIIEPNYDAHAPTKEEVGSLLPDENERQRVIEVFKKGGRIQDDMARRLRGSEPSQTMIHEFLEYMLKFEEGKQFIEDFVLGRIKTRTSGLLPDIPGYQEFGLKLFSRVRNDIRGLLHQKRAHEEQYRSIVV